MGKLCPLTIWEMALREKGDDATYAGSFVSYWLEELLYIDAPIWAFAVLYTSFGLLVVAGWIWIRPRSFRSVRPSSHGHTEGE